MNSNGNKNNDGAGALFVFDAAFTTSHKNQASAEYSSFVMRSVRYSVTLNQSAVSTGTARDCGSSRVSEDIELNTGRRCIDIRRDHSS